MNILVIGNGFDLAHGLPTTYTNFLEFIEAFTGIIDNPHIMSCGYLQNTEKTIYKYLDRLIFKDVRIKKEFEKLIRPNMWIEYFLNNSDYIMENWIDFESEISKVIKSLDDDMSAQKSKIGDQVESLSNGYLAEYYEKNTLVGQSIDTVIKGDKQESITFRKIRDELLEDLNRLIRALEIYLSYYVEKEEVGTLVPDIEKIFFDKVLRFNYTNTYEKLYDVNKLVEYDYIHGQSNIKNDIEGNNMVLGIDEYLDENKRNQCTDFVAFKKFYQRIYKQTSAVYKDWIDDIRSRKIIQNRQFAGFDENGSKIIRSVMESHHNLFIFGHSLDVTDKDILRELILNDNVYTTIFYLNKNVMGQQITNLVKIIGSDELIRRTAGRNKTIEFRLQKK